MSSSDYLQRVTLGKVVRHPRIKLVPYQQTWQRDYQVEADKIQRALGDRVAFLAHVGSTSVPGLTAKPIIDILLIIADTTNESAYVPALEAAGYYLRIREPNWHQHRMFKSQSRDLNLHVFSAGDDEAQQMLNFRDWLRRNTADRSLYQQTKQALAAQDWSTLQDYANAKGPVVTAIKGRANAYFQAHPGEQTLI